MLERWRSFIPRPGVEWERPAFAEGTDSDGSADGSSESVPSTNGPRSGRGGSAAPPAFPASYLLLSPIPTSPSRLPSCLCAFVVKLLVGTA